VQVSGTAVLDNPWIQGLNLGSGFRVKIQGQDSGSGFKVGFCG